MNFIIVVLYVLTILVVGWTLVRNLFRGIPTLLAAAGSFLIGTSIIVPITYFLSFLFVKSGEPIMWGTIATVAVGNIVSIFIRGRPVSGQTFRKSIDFSSVLLVMFVLVFGTWLMFKTFHGGAGGELFVGSNNIFDFGFSLGIIRSFSWGSNIPMTSPFESGSPFFYHFLFYFLVATLEYFKVPLLFAVNIPSILSFAALLIVVYYLPQFLCKQKQILGWIAVIFTITNSSLTFWQIVWVKGVSLRLIPYLWKLPTYPYAGPFDGSAISLYMTLNNYVNQRHLAFSIALGLFVYLTVARSLASRRMPIFLGIFSGFVVGLLFLWNVAAFPIAVGIIALLFVMTRHWKVLGIFLCTTIGVAFVINLPNLAFLYTTFEYLRGKIAIAPAAIAGGRIPSWSLISYLWQNLGILPVIAAFGFVVTPKKYKVTMIPFAVLFILECIAAGIGKRGFDQKYLSFLIIGINILASVGLGWFWRRRKLALIFLAIFFFIILTISGIVDLMPIKNEFSFPLVNKKILPVISWIQANTHKQSVFVSYADMIDPVVFAGRKNYFGFFGNIGWKYRSDSVKRIYAGDTTFTVREGISYILIPKWNKSDFPYIVRTDILKSAFPVTYSDADFLILKVD